MGQAADAFVSACHRVADPATRAALEDLCALFLLGQVDSRSGLLLVGKSLTAGQVGALAGARRRLVARLAPHLTALAAAFDVPEEHLSSLPMLAAGPAPRT